MVQSSRSRSARRGAGLGATHLVSGLPPGARSPHLERPSLSRIARARLAMLDWHASHGRNVSRTCRHFGVSRPTFYRWQARFDPFALERLENRSCRPRRRRRPTWSVAQVEAVAALRERYPRWGKDKLVVLLRRDGIRLSTSMVGRILGQLLRRGALPAPVRRISARKRPWRRPFAIRQPAGYRVAAPGDLIQLDTLDVRPLPSLVLKQFTARDVVSRWDVVELGRRATAASAAAMLDTLAARAPFPVRAISVDGGSEFMADFELACQARGVRLFVLPPRSPKLHGSVERANRTHTEEFYECTTAEPDLASLSAELLAWEYTYNHVRPHQALGQLTPAQFLARWQAATGPV